MIEDQKNKLLSFYQKNKRMPVYREMLSLFGFKSKNAVAKPVDKFVDLGVVAKDATGKLIPNSIFAETPVLGLVKAGFPASAEEVALDSMSIDEFLIEKREATYMLEVDGDSMIDAQIAPGDLVVAERTNNGKDGDIVIAEVDGEWTMKYYREKAGRVWLEPANKKYKPIYPSQSLRVAAVVKGVVRKY